MNGPHPLASAVAAAVVEVGGLLREWRRDPRARSGVWEGSQFKAEADAMAHRALSLRLSAIDDRIPVVSEEDPASLSRRRPPRYWLIDPIDGTASYVHGFDGYVTQAALVIGEHPEVAAVFAPESEVLYTAVRGQGARRDGLPLPAHPPTPPGHGVLTDNTPEPAGIARRAYERFGYGEYLESGSISLKLCRIAEGHAHLFVKDVPVRDWDVAAPGLVLAETGGLVTRLDGTGFSYRGAFEHTGLVGAADPSTCRTVARWATP
ncbi:3'(2'),5'-bisphosphate nucleotidase CysQ [Nocardiopsis terrae]|uniref:inositol-phosphate phosphatase n=1 Tax=Nocardiopsis terrae TaxID=372655 RepID=A0ABR9HDP4_9ACTN|nr:inositol monophosphatase family protein [Nocardiopsis terrae]MBE1457149.1 3'-phosphoadenosine 5'-phosphosulfate (PAPS) 3'-phosphatase [Nocardiopsis terrae]GHC90891.1 3'(2'),5'-bisphosphate nucleotidase CysQ [Nocardiopsis terrae]